MWKEKRHTVKVSCKENYRDYEFRKKMRKYTCENILEAVFAALGIVVKHSSCAKEWAGNLRKVNLPLWKFTIRRPIF